MEHSYQEYPPHLVHHILQQYKPRVRGCGFDALATRYKIKGGGRLVKYWYDKWDGTEFSLIKHSGGDRRSILTPEEKKKHIYDFTSKKAKLEAPTYLEVKSNVEKKTGKRPSLATVKRDGKSLRITSKKRKRVPKSQGL
jgi:hypothetical protein